MSSPDRARDRSDRERQIVAAARDIAEAHGWSAVTTRRLSERIGYTQPVLYSHFQGRRAIVGAVALEGFSELAEALKTAATTTDGEAPPLAAARAYMDFASRHAAVYEAMFTLDNGLAFAEDDTPKPLRETFDATRAALIEGTAHEDPDLVTEAFWAAMHGLVTLAGAGRIPPSRADERLRLLVARFASSPTPAVETEGSSEEDRQDPIRPQEPTDD